jgi:nicotinamidase-related amidase
MQVTYDKQLTALLVIDPYNDFISEGGKIWNRLKAVAEEIAAFRTCCRF